MNETSNGQSPSDEYPRLRRLVGATLVFLPFAYLIWNSLYYWPYQVDDAFISLRYARNLVEGNGLVFNPGERVEGYSNFLWVMLAVAFMVVGAAPLAALKVVGTAAGLGAAWCTWRLGRRLFAGHRLGTAAAWLALVLVGTHSGLAVWSQGGLETNLFAFLMIGSVLRFEVESTDRARRPLSAVLFALAWMTRPH